MSPLLARAVRRDDYDVGRTLLIAGFPRSGTTWLAEIFAGLPRAGLVFEPLDIRRSRDAADAGFDWENFVPPEKHWPSGERFLGNVLAGRVQTRWTASHLPVVRSWRVDRWVVKTVRANQMLAWIIRHFRIPAPVLMVRHPCAVFDSTVRRGWPIASSPPSLELGFFKSNPQFCALIPTLRTPEEYFAADWAMQHITPLSQLPEGSYQLCKYEQLRADGPRAVGRIFQRWNLPMPESIDSSLRRPSAKSSGLAARPEGEAWRSRLAERTISRILGVVHRFGIDLYD